MGKQIRKKENKTEALAEIFQAEKDKSKTERSVRDALRSGAVDARESETDFLEQTQWRDSRAWVVMVVLVILILSIIALAVGFAVFL